MEPILKYAYNQKILLLQQLSMEYNLDYTKLKNKYLDFFKTVTIVREEIINGEKIYIDDNDLKYNKYGFLLK
jgi:hypothetical protein